MNSQEESARKLVNHYEGMKRSTRYWGQEDWQKLVDAAMYQPVIWSTKAQYVLLILGGKLYELQSHLNASTNVNADSIAMEKNKQLLLKHYNDLDRMVYTR